MLHFNFETINFDDGNLQPYMENLLFKT